jgi:hypothetical protein
MSLYRHYLNLRAPDRASLNWSWQKCRREFLKVTARYCICCQAVKKIEVHHILPRHVRPDLTLDHRNLIALCKACHLRLGHLGSYHAYNKNIRDVAWYAHHNNLRIEKEKKP